ncbi:MAG: orotidine-5'-phosphate decarboxylase [Kiritimatiellae bacterium]|nr:orotidine-5'-phosphate decarboxylase [Kiritimatiellia bacterium]
MRKTELIVALDRPSCREAISILAQLPLQIQWFKIGLELFTAEGPAALALLKEKQKNVFLDLKLHDIPNTVARAVRSAASHGASLLTAHTLGGESMLKAAVNAAGEMGTKAPKIIGVTILTSHSQADINSIGIREKISDQVLRLAELALKSGAAGLVASVNEAQRLRQKFGHDFILVTPGIRPAGAEIGDQKRVATPGTAIKAGADFLVVGRPILEAKDPSAAAAAILEEIRIQNSESKINF